MEKTTYRYGGPSLSYSTSRSYALSLFRENNRKGEITDILKYSEYNREEEVWRAENHQNIETRYSFPFDKINTSCWQND